MWYSSLMSPLKQKFVYNPRWYVWIFLLSLVALSFYYHFAEILILRPSGFHIWRQSDCLSIAMNYYDGGMHFFRPAINNQFSDGGNSGLTAGEFPLLYFAVALLWKIFGQHEYIYRLLVLFIAFSALYCLYRMLEDILKDSFWAWVLALLVYTSPIFVYYSINFITNMPAFSLIIIGWYFFYRFFISGKERLLWLSMLFFMLGALLKVSAAISFFVLLYIFFSELTGIIRYKKERRIFYRPLRNFIPFILFVIGLLAWYLYAIHFNRIHGGNYTFNSLWPIWEISSADRIALWVEFRVFLVQQIFSLPVLLLSAGVFITILILTLLKKIPWALTSILIVIFFGCIAYFLLWYQAFNVHDYYLTDTLLLFIFIFGIFFYYLKTSAPGFFNHSLFRIAFLCLLIFCFKNLHNNIHMRLFFNRCPNEQYERYTSSAEVERFQGYFFHMWKASEPFMDIEAYNRSIGIRPEDKVISLPDGTINVSLVLMNQKGWTGFGLGNLSGVERIERFRTCGAKYLFAADSFEFKKPWMQPYTVHPFGQHKGVNIYVLDGIPIAVSDTSK